MAIQQRKKQELLEGGRGGKPAQTALSTGGLAPATGLRTGAQRAEEQLLGLAGTDVLNPGGFAQRDAVRQSLNEMEQMEKRKRRRVNAAYRNAVRRGDDFQAFQILRMAEQDGLNFGGISAAGRPRERVIQERGEDLLTQLALQQQQAREQEPVSMREADFPATQQEQQLAADTAMFMTGGGIFGGAEATGLSRTVGTETPLDRKQREAESLLPVEEFDPRAAAVRSSVDAGRRALARGAEQAKDTVADLFAKVLAGKEKAVDVFQGLYDKQQNKTQEAKGAKKPAKKKAFEGMTSMFSDQPWVSPLAR